jgi:hypothetical protein
MFSFFVSEKVQWPQRSNAVVFTEKFLRSKHNVRNCEQAVKFRLNWLKIMLNLVRIVSELTWREQ